MKNESLLTGKQVEVFCTNVTKQESADMILAQFQLFYPQYKVNFDLDDCDNIFRVEFCEKINLEVIQHVFQKNGFRVCLLEDHQN